MDEIFLEQEVYERHQPAVASRAAEVLELRVVLLIVRGQQAEVAPGAGRCGRGLGGRRGGGGWVRVVRDDSEQLQRGRRRQLQILVRIEPEHLARPADVDRNRGA